MKTTSLTQNPDLTSKGYSNWKRDCYIQFLERGIEDEFENFGDKKE